MTEPSNDFERRFGERFRAYLEHGIGTVDADAMADRVVNDRARPSPFRGLGLTATVLIAAGVFAVVLANQPLSPLLGSGKPRSTGASATTTATTTATPLPTPRPTEPSPSPITFSFDVENHSSMGVVVSVVSDRAHLLPGLEPGQRGTISIPLYDAQNGIYIEIEDGMCGLLAKLYPTPIPFTLIVTDGAQPGSVVLSTRAGTVESPMPLPSNSLRGCLG
jgi:hypothetical protein